VSKWTRVLLHVSNWTRVWNTRVQMDTCIITRVQLDTRIKYARPIGCVSKYTRPKWTRVIIHVSIWTWVFRTRVQLDTCIKYMCLFWTAVQSCIKYMCLFWTAVQLDTYLQRHVSNWTRVYSNKYRRHASKCLYFCSESWVFKIKVISMALDY
jgi:hypothetical protein